MTLQYLHTHFEIEVSIKSKSQSKAHKGCYEMKKLATGQSRVDLDTVPPSVYYRVPDSWHCALNIDFLREATIAKDWPHSRSPY